MYRRNTKLLSEMDMKLRVLSGTVFMVLVFAMMMYLVLYPTVGETFVDVGRCGVDLPSCVGKHIRCMNGYCKSDIPPSLPPFSDLPMTPPTKYPYA
jgi:hypothetical protein